MRDNFLRVRGWRLIGVGLFTLGFTVQARAAFDLTGEGFAGLGDTPVTVSRESIETRSDEPVATARVSNGRFHLHVDAPPGLFNVRVGERVTSFVAGANQTLRLAAVPNGTGLQVSGARDQELYGEYERFRAESLARKVTPVRLAIAAQRASGNEAEATRLTDAEVVAYREHRRELNDFTLTKLRRSPALYAASLRWDGDDRLNELVGVVEEYAQANPGVAIARLMQERLQRFRATALGAVAPELTGSSPSGPPLSLKALRGRYVLVDFWASWCAPCRTENRNYAELYQRYHAAGFEILAVSVDENAAAWKAAIAKDDARWSHLSDLKGWQSPLAVAYSVTALPASFLLDPEGRIVAKDLRGKQLADRLGSLFSKTDKSR